MEPNRECRFDADAHANCDRDGDASASDADADGAIRIDADGDSSAYGDAGTDGYGDTHADGYGYGDTRADRDRDTVGDADAGCRGIRGPSRFRDTARGRHERLDPDRRLRGGSRAYRGRLAAPVVDLAEHRPAQRDRQCRQYLHRRGRRQRRIGG